ncbi:MAG: hypothetical protein ACE5HV_03070 [Acidobacteriota bacterium]
MSDQFLPASRRLAIIGGGPIGLETALYGLRLGYRVTLYEADRIGANMLAWGHVQMFSPWSMNVSPLGVDILQRSGWRHPDADQCPRGGEFVRRYLQPLAELIGQQARFCLGTRVVAVGRDGRLKGDAIGDEARGRAPLRLLIEEHGVEKVATAERVIDATGVYGQHNWLGSAGIPAPGERKVSDRIAYRLEDYLGAARSRYAGARVMELGSGHSAATAVCALAGLASGEPGTLIHWVVRSRRQPPVTLFANDPLPSRQRLAAAANELAAGADPAVGFLAGYTVGEVSRGEDGLKVRLEDSEVDGDGSTSPPVSARRAPSVMAVDRIVALVGYRPDLEIGRELQLHTCWATEGPMKLAASLLGEVGGDCLAQSNPGPHALAMPEPGYLWMGHKSYGRNPSFLLRLGHEQIRDGFRLWEESATLDLYATAAPASLPPPGRVGLAR